MPKFQAAIFDVDGVLVDSPHEKAWRESLRELMESSWRGIRGRATWWPDAFTSHVYQQYVSGKPRMSGARAALDYFQVPDADNRVAEYAQHKQEMVVRLIQAGDFTAYPDALRFVIATRDAGMLIADASSSKNAALFLRQIRLDTFAQEHGISSPTLRPGLTLLDYFDADVSGRDFAHGKPDPEIFLTAAHELGVEPGNAIVIEDASAGVQAAKAGGMAAIGVARADDADLLAAADADLVVTTLDDVDATALCEGRLARRQALCGKTTPSRRYWAAARPGLIPMPPLAIIASRSLMSRVPGCEGCLLAGHRSGTVVPARRPISRCAAVPHRAPKEDFSGPPTRLSGSFGGAAPVTRPDLSGQPRDAQLTCRCRVWVGASLALEPTRAQNNHSRAASCSPERPDALAHSGYVRGKRKPSLPSSVLPGLVRWGTRHLSVHKYA